MDPFGHLTSQYYKTEIKEGLDVSLIIAITRAHMIVPERFEYSQGFCQPCLVSPWSGYSSERY